MPNAASILFFCVSRQIWLENNVFQLPASTWCNILCRNADLQGSLPVCVPYMNPAEKNGWKELRHHFYDTRGLKPQSCSWIHFYGRCLNENVLQHNTDTSIKLNTVAECGSFLVPFAKEPVTTFNQWVREREFQYNSRSSFQFHSVCVGIALPFYCSIFGEIIRILLTFFQLFLKVLRPPAPTLPTCLSPLITFSILGNHISIYTYACICFK